MAVTDKYSRAAEMPGQQDLPRLQWTRTQFHQLAQSGIIADGRRYELIAGEIIPEPPQNRAHALTLMLVLDHLQSIYGRGRVQPRLPIAIDDSNEPEPDLSVLNAPATAFVNDHPGPANVALVVEVAVATQHLDSGAKSLLYARSGILEYWILDVEARRLIVRRTPSQEGYLTSITLSDRQSIAPVSAPGNELIVTDLLPRGGTR